MKTNLTHFLLLGSLVLGISHIYAQQPEVLVDSLDKPSSLALKGDELFFSEEGAGNIWKIDISDPNAEPELVVNGIVNPKSLAFHGDDLYVMSYNAGGELLRFDVTVPNPSIFSHSIGWIGQGNMVFDSDTLFLVGRASGINSVFKIDINNPPGGYALGTIIYNMANPFGLAISGGELFISNFDGNNLLKVILSDFNAGTSNFKTNMSNPAGIDIANGKLYIAEYNGYQVLEIDLADPNAQPQRVTLVDGGPVDVLFANNKLYIAEYIDGELSVFDFNPTSIEDGLDSRVTIFPNPVNNRLTIDGLLGREAFVIVDELGRTVQKGIVETDGIINLESLAAGVYSLRLVNTGVARFVKS